MTLSLADFADRDVVFVGAGHGRSAHGVEHYLKSHVDLRSFALVDKQATDHPLDFLLDYPDGTVFIKNEAIPPHEIPVPYISTTQLFFDLVRPTGATIIGITGTKGKSTTTALLAHILTTAGRDARLAGNIGVSPFEVLAGAGPDTIFVLELSSYQLADLTTSPYISACLNLYHDHTDWHGSVESYWGAKHNIMRYATRQDLFVYPLGFDELDAWARSANCRTLAIDPSEPLSLSGAQLYGDHNHSNALVARAIARELGVDDATTQAAIDSFQPLAHRMQLVATTGDHIYIDDAIGMTPESTMASLAAVSQRYGQVGCLLLGGQDRDYDFHELLRKVTDHQVPYLVLFPDTIAKMRASLPGGYSPTIYEATDMPSAVAWAASHAPAGSVVLLSTAAPSYSLWDSFEQKGAEFQSAVASLDSTQTPPKTTKP